MLQLPVDDTAGGEHEDALMEMGFFVPRSAEGFTGEEGDETPSASVSPAPPTASSCSMDDSFCCGLQGRGVMVLRLMLSLHASLTQSAIFSCCDDMLNLIQHASR